MFYFHIIYLKSTGAGIASCIFIFLIHWYWPSISPSTSRVYLLACSYWRLNTLCRKLNLSPPSLKMRVFLSICFNSNTAFSNLLIVLSLISSCGIINWAYSLKYCHSYIFWPVPDLRILSHLRPKFGLRTMLFLYVLPVDRAGDLLWENMIAEGKIRKTKSREKILFVGF